VSLIKRLMMTPEKLAPSQANGRQSQGPATPASLERLEPVRAANTRHGYYSQAPGAQMHVLGEDPEEFERLLESLLAVWEPENEYQISPVRRMARLTWRLERADARFWRLPAGSEASAGGVVGSVGRFRLAAASLYHRPADEAESAGKQASGRRRGPEKRGISHDLIEDTTTYKSLLGISHDVIESTGG
jgi:hypothetical protein